jgi:peptide/nickel transport system substrate-binding protein
MLFSNFTPHVKNNYSGQNIYYWLNPRADEIYSELGQVQEEAKRIKLLHSLQANYTADLPAIPLYFRTRMALVSKRVMGFKLNRYDGSALTVQDWSFSHSHQQQPLTKKK